VYGYEHGTLRNRAVTYSYATLLRYLDDHPDLPDSILPAKRISTAIGGRVSVYGSAHYILSGLPGDGVDQDVDDFYDKLHHGEALGPGSPILAFRRQIISTTQAGSVRGPRMSQVHQLALLFKTWNAWRAGDQLTVVNWRGGGKRAESFPTPE
jgi:hypothetical protein